MKVLRKQFTITFFALFIVSNLAVAQFGKANKIELPPTYDFTWIMKMDMKSKRGSFAMDYYMKEDATYFGFKNDMITKQVGSGNVFMVMDVTREVTALFIDMMGRKILQKTSLKDIEEEEDVSNEFQYKQIGSKTILGYKCDGFQAENAEYKVLFYISNQVPVSFTKVWGADKKNMPKGFNTAWIKKYADNGAVLEMQFEDKKKSKNSMTMTCTVIEKINLSINTKEYKGMF